MQWIEFHLLGKCHCCYCWWKGRQNLQKLSNFSPHRENLVSVFLNEALFNLVTAVVVTLTVSDVSDVSVTWHQNYFESDHENDQVGGISWSKVAANGFDLVGSDPTLNFYTAGIKDITSCWSLNDLEEKWVPWVAAGEWSVSKSSLRKNWARSSGVGRRGILAGTWSEWRRLIGLTSYSWILTPEDLIHFNVAFSYSKMLGRLQSLRPSFDVLKEDANAGMDVVTVTSRVVTEFRCAFWATSWGFFEV